MNKIEIVYSTGCPNVDAARAAVRSALSSLGLPRDWREWNTESPETPDDLRGYGSPTILVDGRDVAEAAPAAGSACRLYDDGKGSLSGVPPIDRIVEALDRSRRTGLAPQGDG